MGTVTIEQRFHGTVALAILHLRRLAKSNDIDEGFAAARELGMLKPEHESFMRSCLCLDERIQLGEQPDQPVTEDLARELQACVLRINSADPA